LFDAVEGSTEGEGRVHSLLFGGVGGFGWRVAAEDTGGWFEGK
jgi:hypothetical protein